MKNLYTKAAIFIALCMVWLPQATAATSTYDIESNGLYYTITDTLEPGMKYAGIVKVVAPPTGKYDGEVTIPSSFSATIKNSRYSFLVSAIGANAFASSTVTKVTLPTTILTIGDNAFSNCQRLDSVKVAENAYDKFKLKEIGANAFRDCYNLSSFHFGKYLQSIGETAFCYCYKLSDLTLQRSATIASKAFMGSGIKSLTLPDTARYEIKSQTFMNCKWLEKADLGGTVYLADMAFSICYSLTSVKATKVRYIGVNVFEWCKNLTTLDFGESTDGITVNDGAFINCPALTDFNALKRGMICFYGSPFGGTTKLQSASFSANSINKGVLSGNTSLRSVKFGEVYVISDSAFAGCTALSDIDLGNSHLKMTIYDNAFKNCTSLSKINTAEVFCTEIKAKAFDGCTGLQDITLGYSPSILKKTFANLPKLSKVTLTQTYVIGDSAFANCPSLTTFNFGEDKKTALTVGEMAFAGCSSLSRINITGYLSANIASTSFTKCTGLQDITLGYSPSILKKTFANLPKLSKVTLTKTYIIGDSAFANCPKLTTFSFGEDKNTSLQIGNMAFAGCSSLSSVNTLGYLYTVFAGTPFAGCSSLAQLYTKVTLLPKGTFAYLPNLRTVSFKSVYEIGASAFEGCTKLSSVDFGKQEDNGDHSVVINSMAFANTSISQLSNSDRTIVIASPTAFKGNKSLTLIDICTPGLPAHAFQGSPKLANVTLRNVIEIADEAFSGCESLNKVTLTAMNSTQGTTIGNYAFAGSSIASFSASYVKFAGKAIFNQCHSLTDVTITSTPIVTDSLFAGTALTNVTLNADTIGRYAFAGTPLNGNVNLGNVKRIQQGAFMNSSIVTMKLPSTVKLIPEKAFANCQYLRWVGFDAVTTIEAEAFRNCENLQKIVLPATVTYIGKYAFAGTRSMRSVYSLRLTPPSALLLAFGEEVRSKTLYVYPSAYLKYAAAYVWCDFGSYEKPDLSGVDNVESNGAVTIKAENGTIIVDGAASGERVDVYSVGGRLVYSGTASEPIDVPSGGIYVVRTAGTSVKVKI